MKITERILVAQVLPVEGNYETLIIVEDIKKKVTLTQKEITEIDVKTIEGGALQWNQEKDKGIEIEFTEAEKNLIKTELEKINKENKLKSNMITLYKQFCA